MIKKNYLDQKRDDICRDLYWNNFADEQDLKKAWNACAEILLPEIERLSKLRKADWDYINQLSDQVADLKRKLAVAKKALTKAEKRFSHIENWHRDNITAEYFQDCQEVGMTPESYLRDGKIEARAALKELEGQS